MARLVFEVFDEFAKAKTREERINVLRRDNSFALKSVLKGTFDPKVQFVITEAPPYKSSDAPPGLGYSTIHQELGRVYLFQRDHPRVAPGFTDKRRREILIQILEVLESREAEVFMNMLLKKTDVPGLDASIVEEAFPGLL